MPFPLLVDLVRNCLPGSGGGVGNGLQNAGVTNVVIVSSTSSSHVFVLVNVEGEVGVFVLFGAEDFA